MSKYSSSYINNGIPFRKIPIPLCEEVLKKRLTNYFRFYLYLNINNDGYCQKSDAIKGSIKNLKVSRKTVYNLINRCIELDWLGYDNGIIYIRSIDWLNRNIFHTRKAILVQKTDIPKIKELMFAGLITSFINVLKWNERTKGKRFPGQKKWGPNQRKPFPLSISLTSARYGFSDNYVKKMMKRCKEKGFLDYKQHYEKLIFEGSETKNKNDLKRYRKYYGPDALPIVLRNGTFYIQKPNKVTPLISLYRRGKYLCKNDPTYICGYISGD